jgi:hypothetical protein
MMAGIKNEHRAILSSCAMLRPVQAISGLCSQGRSSSRAPSDALVKVEDIGGQPLPQCSGRNNDDPSLVEAPLILQVP